MKIISFQHKKVLDDILNNGIYRCEYISQFHKEAPKCYKYLRDKVYEKTNIDNNPVFGWANIIIDKKMEVDKETISRAYEMVPFEENDYYILELEIPNELLIVQDFYDFACYKADEMEGVYEPISDKLLQLNYGREMQAVFPYIKKEWLINIYSYTMKVIQKESSIFKGVMSDYIIVDKLEKIKI